jgi:signal transduction histidine kinase
MQLNNDIAARAALGFALVSGVTAAAVISSAMLSRRAADEREQILVRYADDLEHASRAQAAAERMVAGSRGYLLTGAPALMNGVKRSEEDLDTTLEELDRGTGPAAERELLRNVQQSAARYRHSLDDILRTTTATEDRRTLATVLRDRLLPARGDLEEGIRGLVALKGRQQAVARDEAGEMAVRAVWVTLLLGSAALILSALLAWIFTRRMADIYEQERSSARSATRALAAKQELLGIVAHDLRSPLNSILLRASSIAKNSADTIIQSSATSIQATCTHMANLIQSLLDAASIEAGQMSIVLVRCRVDEVFSDIVETFGPAAGENGVRLDQRVTPHHLVVRADRARLLQVLSNLVGNAMRFTPAGGAISISARETGGTVIFEVQDDGPGVSAAHQSRVFERYWRSDGMGKGVGLGLYIAKGIVEAHGGHIWVESSPGHGASFLFEIPPSLPSSAREPETGDSLVVTPRERPSVSKDPHHTETAQ